MKAPHPATSPEVDAAEAAAAEGETPPPPPPEPWTAERVLAWNAYYDLYVAAGVLLMAFLTSAVLIGNAAIWAHLRAGQLILRRGPLTTDPFSYTMAGARWVDIPWLFQAAVAALYRLGNLMVPGETPAEMARADRIGSYALVAANALVRMLTALVLMGVRRPGPGAWWVAVCVAAGLGLLNGPAPLAPETWGYLLLAAEVVLIQRASTTGGQGSAWALVPLFLLWANLDETFLLGLVLLAAATLGSLGRRSSGAWTPGLGGSVLAASLVAVLANPSLFRVYPVAWSGLIGPLLAPLDQRLIPLELFVRTGKLDLLWFLDGPFLMTAVVGLVSFVVNRKAFNGARFGVFLAATVVGELLYPFRGAFAIVAAATVAANGQEWYQSRFGTEGRLGAGWAAWSVGGRALTIVGLFAVIASAITGYWAREGDPLFGFGYKADDFAFESAEFLAKSPIRGQVLNTNAEMGDALIWKSRASATPRPTFLDSRQGVFPPSVLDDLKTLRTGLSTDEPGEWRDLLAKYGIDVVMISRNARGAAETTLGNPSLRTYATLNASKDWIPFYDDGNVALFGARQGAIPEDLAYFESRRLDAQALAFHQAIPTRSTQEPPPVPSPLDRYFRIRALSRPQPHVRRAQDWLIQGSSDAPDQPTDLAHALLAVREARTAIAARPDDAASYAILADAYRNLSAREALVMGPEAISRGGGLAIRLQQRITALNFAIQASPPPTTPEGRELLRRLNLELSQLYRVVGALDLERERLAKAREYGDREDFSVEAQRRLDQLDAAIAEVRTKMDEAGAEAQGNSAPIVRANLAQQSGMIGLAIAELKGSESQGVAPEAIRARLVDLYCLVGQADVAQDLIGQSQALDDPSLETEPGMGYYRHARIFLLMGDYGSAMALYAQAIGRLRNNTIRQALDTASSSMFPMGRQTGTLQGNFLLATRLAMELPSQLATEASWESELGLLLLEAGDPKTAGEELTKALTLAPDLPVRPLAAALLEAIGLPVPPPKSETTAATTTAPAAGDSSAAPSSGELPAEVFTP